MPYDMQERSAFPIRILDAYVCKWTDYAHSVCGTKKSTNIMHYIRMHMHYILDEKLEGDTPTKETKKKARLVLRRIGAGADKLHLHV